MMRLQQGLAHGKMPIKLRRGMGARQSVGLLVRHMFLGLGGLQGLY